MSSAAIFLVGLGIWAWSNTSRKGEAEQQVKDIQAEVDERTGYSKPLGALAKQEARLDAMAAQLVNAQSARVLWVDVWNDLAFHFASDIVWLVDFDPVVGFKSKEVSEGSAGTAQSVIASDFTGIEYGKSAVAKITIQPVASTGRRRGAAPAPKEPMINAIKIKGFWRGTNGNKEVIKLIDQLRNGSKYFDVLPTEKTIISLPVTLEEGSYATAFELVIPLKKAVPAPSNGGTTR